MENALIFKQILPTNEEMYGDQSWEFVSGTPRIEEVILSNGLLFLAYF